MSDDYYSLTVTRIPVGHYIENSTATNGREEIMGFCLGEMPSQEELREARDWIGDESPLWLEVTDNGEHGDGTELSLTFEGKGPEKLILDLSLSQRAVLLLREALDSILRLREAQKRELPST